VQGKSGLEKQKEEEAKEEVGKKREEKDKKRKQKKCHKLHSACISTTSGPTFTN